MKIQADYKVGENEYKRINIWNIYNDYKEKKNNGYPYDIHQFYKDYYKGNLYSTNRKNKVRLSLYIAKPFAKSYFKYYPNTRIDWNEESLSHELFKDIISDFTILKLKTYNNDLIKLYISRSEIEYKFYANDNCYYADIYFWFYKSEPANYILKWQGQLCFEIFHTHKTEQKKVKDCLLNNIAVFEHTISPAFLIENCYSEKTLLKKEENIILSLSSEIYGEILSDPASNEYKEIVRIYQKLEQLQYENKQIINTVDYYKNTVEELNKKLDKEINEKVELEKFKKSIENNKFFAFVIKLFRIK